VIPIKDFCLKSRLSLQPLLSDTVLRYQKKSGTW